MDGEETLMARFTLPEAAHAAEESLRRAGFDVVRVSTVASDIDRVGEPVVEWGRYGYQSTLVDDKWTSAAAWDNPLGINLGESVLLTTVVPAADRERAAGLIREAGGIL